MRQKRLIPIILLCALLAGCATKTAEIPDSGLLSQQAIAEQYQVDRAWWKIYGDQTLDALVDEALVNNIDLRKSAINVNKALYQANLLGEDLIPSFYDSAGAGASKNLQKGITSHTYNAQLGVSYEIDLWHRLRYVAEAPQRRQRAGMGIQGHPA